MGKLPTRALPWCNHSWHLALRVTPRGFRSYPVITQRGEAEVTFDCIDSRLVIHTSDGFTDAFGLTGQSVAEFHKQFTALLELGQVWTDISGAPNEVEVATPFIEDAKERSWHAPTVRVIHRAFSDVNRTFETFRSGFVGKFSPSHLFRGKLRLGRDTLFRT